MKTEYCVQCGIMIGGGRKTCSRKCYLELRRNRNVPKGACQICGNLRYTLYRFGQGSMMCSLCANKILKNNHSALEYITSHAVKIAPTTSSESENT